MTGKSVYISQRRNFIYLMKIFCQMERVVIYSHELFITSAFFNFISPFHFCTSIQSREINCHMLLYGWKMVHFYYTIFCYNFSAPFLQPQFRRLQDHSLKPNSWIENVKIFLGFLFLSGNWCSWNIKKLETPLV